MHLLSYLPLFRKKFFRHGPRSRRTMALTFDDGPDEHTTPQVVEILSRRAVRATFFVTGREVAKAPDIVRMTARAGHEIGIHGYDHRPGLFREQVRRCDEQLASLGLRSAVLRPPAGTVRFTDFLWFLRQRRPVVLWSFDARDSMRHEKKWNGALPDYGSISPGDIVLLHDDNPVCLAELPHLLDTLTRLDLRPVSVSELLS